MSLFTTTCEPSPQRLWQTPVSDDAVQRVNGKINSRGEPKLSAQVLISSAAASLARTSVSPERARALQASAAAYGRSTPELLARYDPSTQSWRTSQLCLDGELSVFSETWPRSGLIVNGTAYQLPPLVRLTDATGSGSWPTPRAGEKTQGIEAARAYAKAGHRQPTVRNGKTRSGGTFDTTLTTAMLAVQMWPTPTADRYSGLQSHGQNAILGSLNPTWVEWLMGFPLGWTVCEPSATPSSRKSPKSSGGQS